MNVKQQQKFNEIRRAADAKGHAFIWSSGRMSQSITGRCTCGHVVSESRRQNALARNAKLDAAVRRHFDAILG
jgi:hypothetical protein